MEILNQVQDDESLDFLFFKPSIGARASWMMKISAS